MYGDHGRKPALGLPTPNIPYRPRTAAVAEAHGCTVVTDNEKEFVEIQVINPLRGAVRRQRRESNSGDPLVKGSEFRVSRRESLDSASLPGVTRSDRLKPAAVLAVSTANGFMSRVGRKGNGSCRTSNGVKRTPPTDTASAVVDPERPTKQ